MARMILMGVGLALLGALGLFWAGVEHQDAFLAKVEPPEAVCEPRLDPASPPRWVGLPGEHRLEVRVSGARKAIAGRMVKHSTGLMVFKPKFPFGPGIRYEVRGDSCKVAFEPPAHRAPNPSVVSVYPRVTELPENVLRFYVYFSEPMADGDFLEHIRLEHVETGQILTDVFFDNIYELWSRDRKRITLLVDPGRVKTGLEANQRLGRAFPAGQTYRLHVLTTWKSLRGMPLDAPFIQTYRTIHEDRQPVDVQAWRVTFPDEGSTEALTIDFGEPVDHVSLHHLLHILSPEGMPVRGAWALEDGDQKARWVPEQPWQAPIDRYTLRVHGRFEDIAGNNLGAAFDHHAGAVVQGQEDRFAYHHFGDLIPTP